MDIPYDISFTFEPAELDNEQVVQIQGEERITYTFTRMKTEDINPDQLKEFVGDYYCEEINTRYKILFKDDMLHFSKKTFPPETLKFIANDLFFWTYITFCFSRDTKNQVVGFSLGAGRVKNLKFVKRNFGLNSIN